MPENETLTRRPHSHYVFWDEMGWMARGFEAKRGAREACGGIAALGEYMYISTERTRIVKVRKAWFVRDVVEDTCMRAIVFLVF